MSQESDNNRQQKWVQQGTKQKGKTFLGLI